MIWEVGKTYLTRDRRAKVTIFVTDMRHPKPIGGQLIERDQDGLYQFNADGHLLSGRDSVLDLTTEECAP